jgi:membrane fusion protein (multidrug efflux system)
MKIIKIKSAKIYLNVLYAICLVLFGYYLSIRISAKTADVMTVVPSVQVKGLKKEDVSIKKKFIAQVEAINSVDVIPQVSGYIEEIKFDNGAEVKAGDVLFVIEQRRYKDNLKAAEATTKQYAADFKRLTSLHEKKFISDKDLEVSESNLRNAEAAEDLARLDLEYTEVKSPIDGVIGKALVTVGNLVSMNTQKLARIVQIDPIRLVFSVTDKQRMEVRKDLSEDDSELFVDIELSDGEIISQPADRIFVGNEVNTTTATIPVHIDIDNKNGDLVPGNYVNIYMHLAQPQLTLTVPQIELSEDSHGTYVMTVKKTGDGDKYIAQQKYIKLGNVLEDSQIVLSGLEENDLVVVEGIQKVRDGAEIRPIFVDVDNNNNKGE